MNRLRDVVPEDEAQLLAWRNMPEVSRFMYTDHEITPGEHARWFRGMLEDDRSRYWVIQTGGEDVGVVNITGIDRTHRRCAWAFYIAAEEGRGRGVGAFVEHAVIRHVFEELELHKLCCEVLAFNKGVVKMHKRFGFREEARYREHIFKGGEWHDVVGMALLRQEWEACRDEVEAGLRERGLLPPEDEA